MSQPVEPAKTPPTSGKPAKKGSNISVGQILAGVLLVLVVVFIVENTRSVPIRFIAGPEVNVPVYLALLIAAVVGALIASLMRYRRNRKK